MIRRNLIIYFLTILIIAFFAEKCNAQKFIEKKISYSPDREVEIKVGEYDLITEIRLEDEFYFESMCIESTDFYRLKSIVDNSTNWCYLKIDNEVNEYNQKLQKLNIETINLKRKLEFENKNFKYAILGAGTIIFGLTIIILFK